MLRRVAPIGLLAVAWLTACSPPCQEALGVYPPPVITVVGAESVQVPHIGWECPGFNSDSMDPPPSVAPGADGSVTIDLDMEAGSTLEVRFGNSPVVLDPAPDEGGNSWALDVPDPAEPLIVRLCSAAEACAMYWLNLYPDQPGA